MASFKVEPVGYVRQKNDLYCIELDKKYSVALTGLDKFSHVNVIWWAHGFNNEEYGEILTVDKPYKKGPDKLGIFATRSPVRPNLIMTSSAGIKSVNLQKGIVDLYWIDAVDGTPVLDLKPYHPSDDRIRDCRVPSWCAHWPQWYEDSASFNWQAEFNF